MTFEPEYSLPWIYDLMSVSLPDAEELAIREY